MVPIGLDRVQEYSQFLKKLGTRTVTKPAQVMRADTYTKYLESIWTPMEMVAYGGTPQCNGMKIHEVASSSGNLTMVAVGHQWMASCGERGKKMRVVLTVEESCYTMGRTVLD